MSELPLPMLAVRSGPFDSEEYLFEVKWDGVRALAAAEAGGWLLWGRGRADYRGRYPELAFLAGLPPGTVLDGELVLAPAGVPDLAAVLSRHGRAGPAAPGCGPGPVTYVVFDALSARGASLLGRPLEERREAARGLVEALGEPRLVFSEGVVGAGRAFFEAAVRHGLEGVMAKHRAGRYRPGRRSAAWKKIKPPRRR